jgi:hypothetical protein
MAVIKKPRGSKFSCNLGSLLDGGAKASGSQRDGRGTVIAPASQQALLPESKDGLRISNQRQINAPRPADNDGE